MFQRRNVNDHFTFTICYCPSCNDLLPPVLLFEGSAEPSAEASVSPTPEPSPEVSAAPTPEGTHYLFYISFYYFFSLSVYRNFFMSHRPYSPLFYCRISKHHR